MEARPENKAGLTGIFSSVVGKAPGPDRNTEVVKYEDRYRERSFSAGAESRNY